MGKKIKLTIEFDIDDLITDVNLNQGIAVASELEGDDNKDPETGTGNNNGGNSGGNTNNGNTSGNGSNNGSGNNSGGNNTESSGRPGNGIGSLGPTRP